MKKILLTLSLLCTLNANAAVTKLLLRKPLPTFPSQIEPALGKIWDKCIANADEVTLTEKNSIILSNLNRDCSIYGLNEMYFHALGNSYVFINTESADPFAKLRNKKITLYSRLRNINQERLEANSTFIPFLSIDVRLNAIYNGVPNDYFISQRDSVEGWNKVAQELISTESRTEFCRPNINCTYTVKTFKQTWKSSVTGQTIVKTVSQLQ